MDKCINKLLKYSSKFSGISIVLNKSEIDKKRSIEERDRFLHRIKQLELEVSQYKDINKEQTTENAFLGKTILRKWPESTN